MGWVVFLAIAIPLIAVVVWAVLDDSFVQVEPGQLGLLLVRGRATDRALEPGMHWVPALRRRMLQTYPSTELSFRASDPDGHRAGTSLECVDSAPHVLLGDRVVAAVDYTIRFQLATDQLRSIHERFGPHGIWAAVRDESARTVRSVLGAPTVGADDVFGAARTDLERRLGGQVSEDLARHGFVVTMFGLGDIDLGDTGEVIQATARARFGADQEQAEAPLRLARARVDADVAPIVADVDVATALRYRELDVLRQLARAAGHVTPAVAGALPAELLSHGVPDQTEAPEDVP